MSEAFGGPCHASIEQRPADQPASVAVADMEFTGRLLAGLAAGGPGLVRIYQPAPTAAFAISETRLPGFAEAQKAVAELGFAPLMRQPGGHLAIYDGASIILDIIAPHPSPREGIISRFQNFAASLAASFRHFGAHAAVGPVAGEFCPGTYSINHAAKHKLAGVAQRVGRNGYHLSALIQHRPSPASIEALRQAYDWLGLDFDPESQGSLTEIGRVPDFSEFADRILADLQSQLGLDLIGGNSARSDPQNHAAVQNETVR